MVDTLAALMAEVEEMMKPHDPPPALWDTLRVLADCTEEEADPARADLLARRAKALRWMAKRKNRPGYAGGLVDPWDWWRVGSKCMMPEELPLRLFRSLDRLNRHHVRGYTYLSYTSLWGGAVDALAAVLPRRGADAR